jgi:hypothetical protein
MKVTRNTQVVFARNVNIGLIKMSCYSHAEVLLTNGLTRNLLIIFAFAKRELHERKQESNQPDEPSF